MMCAGGHGRERSGLYSLMLGVFAAALAVIAGCAMGPEYRKPETEVPAAYKETANWKLAQPQEAIVRGEWWKIFQDPRLDALEEQVELSNQNIAAAEARYRQAVTVVQAARTGYFPTITADAHASRSLRSSNAPGVSARSNSPYSDYLLSGTASWEPDLWGRVRSNVESGQAGAQASAADLESIRLSVHALLAQSYFQLCALDAQRTLLDATAAAYRKSLEMTENRYANGVSSRADVLKAETQLKSTQAQAIDLGVQRSQLENAIAVIIGRPPSLFIMPAIPLSSHTPAIPAGIPSEILERRPDIAAAERRVAAANAQIGVARAAYFPDIILGATGGYGSSSISNWLSWPSRLWSVGLSLSQTLFDAGLRSALTDQARAVYDTTVASYRQAVLIGFQEVEDNLAALRILEEESRVQDEAVRAARRSLELSMNQYKAGMISYLEVVIVQAILLANERTAVDIMGRRMIASVLLIKATGGGWDASTLPSGI
jgi:NodT family efflux transporter outer membrane factor (OMF) lipoprotein